MTGTGGHVLAIDPGNVESAYVLADYGNGNLPKQFDKLPNECLHLLIREIEPAIDYIVIERIASQGQVVGASVFDTVHEIGYLHRLSEELGFVPYFMFRTEVKRILTGRTNTKDSDVIAALVKQFDPEGKRGKYGKGTKANPGPFYGFSADVWQAFGLAVAWGGLMAFPSRCAFPSGVTDQCLRSGEVGVHEHG